MVVRRRRLILALTCVFVVVAGVAGVNVFERLGRRGFDDPGSESVRARQVLEDELHAGDPDVVLLVDAGEAGVDDPAVVSAGEALTEELASRTGRVGRFLLVARTVHRRCGTMRDARRSSSSTSPAPSEEVADAATALVEDRTGRDGPLTIGVGGREAVAAAITDQVRGRPRAGRADRRARSRSCCCVSCSAACGRRAAAGGRARGARRHVPRAVPRRRSCHRRLGLRPQPDDGARARPGHRLQPVHRLPLPGGAAGRARPRTTPCVRTVRTAGRTVAFSALTVAVSLAALLVFPLSFLRSFAYAGVAVVVLAGAGRVDRPAGPARRPRHRGSTRCACCTAPARSRSTEGFWHRMATSVMRRPVPIATAVVAVLLVLGARSSASSFGLPDDRVLPGATPVRRSSTTSSATELRRRTRRALRSWRPTADVARPPIDAYADRLSRSTASPGSTPSPASTSTARSVRAPRCRARSERLADATCLSVVPAVEPMSAEGEARGTTDPRRRRAVRRAVGGPVGRARRRQGGALRPPAARARRSSPSPPSCCCS